MPPAGLPVTARPRPRRAGPDRRGRPRREPARASAAGGIPRRSHLPHLRCRQAAAHRPAGAADQGRKRHTGARGREGFEGRSSFRAWLYRIATNTCLDFLRRNKRVPRPYDPLPDVEQGEPPQFLPWLQPFPDDSAEIAETRETMELVFLAAIQHLPPKQRAVVILNDVLGWKAAETADLLETSVASVTSALQRARPTLRERLPERRTDWARTVRPTEEEQAILRRYMAAATADGDSRVMAELLREDVLVTMPPNPLWFSGRDVFLGFVAKSLDPASPTYFGEWKHLPTVANGLPAAAGYVRRPGTRIYRAQVLDVLRIEDGQVAEITAFEPHLFPAFGLPLTLT
ncbi:RNA polymerase subunit sigma-70 [Amycolatopsis sp. SB7-3]|uniref:RNA polymerase subunit sigma-70 n=1 Tax=Amycolatopsis sp. SB7-3 TaxID=3373438 RepID=UPI00374229F7